MYKRMLRISLIGMLGILFSLPAQAGLPGALQAKVERQVAAAPKAVESSFDYALDVKIRISQPDGNERIFYRPGVVVGKKHLLMYLGELKKGEVIRLLQVEKQFTVFDFKASYNNVWVSEDELYQAFDKYHMDRISHIILLLPLPEPIGNFAYGVFGLDMPDAQTGTDFVRAIKYSLARRTNLLGVWDRLIPVTMGRVEQNISGVPVYHTSSVRWPQKEGNPLFVRFHEKNAFGMPVTWLMLVGFKIEGENSYCGFSGTHVRQGRQLAPDVTWFGH